MARAILVLETIAAHGQPLTLAELTARLRLPKSSVLAICTTLIEGAFLQRDAKSGAFWLGRGLVEISRVYLSRSNTTAYFLEAWNALEIQPEETVVLSVLDGLDVVYVACQNGTHGLTFNYQIGLRLPASCTASGKAILSTHTAETLEALFAGKTLPRRTAKSITDMASLQRDLGVSRKRGYALDREELREGMCCVGVPVFSDVNGPATAAIAISLLKAEFNPEKRDQVIETVSELADKMTGLLTGGARRAAASQNGG